jgi:hypothetical protein
MTGLDRKSGSDPIRELVEADESQALARFRNAGFEERLKRRLAEQTVAPPLPGRLRPALRPVWVPLAALIILGAAAVWLLRPRHHTAQGGAAVAALFRALPGLRAIEFPAPAPAGVLPLPASPLERNIGSVLSVSRGASGAPGPGPGRGFWAIDPGAKPLDLQRFYEILVIDRSIERVLSDISPKIKEG